MGPLEGQPRPWDAPGCCGFAQAQEPSDQPASSRGCPDGPAPTQGSQGQWSEPGLDEDTQQGSKGSRGRAAGRAGAWLGSAGTACASHLCFTPRWEVWAGGRHGLGPAPPPSPCGCLSLARTPEWWPLVGVWSVTRLTQPWHGERAVTCRAAIPRGRLPCRSPGRGRGAGWHAHSRGAGHPCLEGWGGQSPSESPLLPRHAGRVPNRGLSRRKDPVGGLWPHVVGGSWDLETKPVRGP